MYAASWGGQSKWGIPFIRYNRLARSTALREMPASRSGNMSERMTRLYVASHIRYTSEINVQVTELRRYTLIYTLCLLFVELGIIFVQLLFTLTVGQFLFFVLCAQDKATEAPGPGLVDGNPWGWLRTKATTQGHTGRTGGSGCPHLVAACQRKLNEVLEPAIDSVVNDDSILLGHPVHQINPVRKIGTSMEILLICRWLVVWTWEKLRKLNILPFCGRLHEDVKMGEVQRKITLFEHSGSD